MESGCHRGELVDFLTYARISSPSINYQHLIGDSGSLHYLVDLQKRHKDGLNSRAVNGVSRRAADAIPKLAHEYINIKSHVRIEGGLPSAG